MRSKQGQMSKNYKFCFYFYKKGHDDYNCPDNKSSKPLLNMNGQEPLDAIFAIRLVTWLLTVLPDTNVL